jgi:integrase
MEHKAAKRFTAYRTGEFALTKGEYEKLIQAAGSIEDRVMVMLAVSLGLRRGDLVRIRLSDVDLKNCTISYHEKKKGDRVRTIPIGPRMALELKILMKTLPGEQETVFSFKDRQAYNRFVTLCDIAGIPRRPFHSLRATAIKFAQAAGWSPEQVAELTGDTIKVIQEHYATPSRAEMGELVKAKEII